MRNCKNEFSLCWLRRPNTIGKNPNPIFSKNFCVVCIVFLRTNIKSWCFAPTVTHNELVLSPKIASRPATDSSRCRNCKPCGMHERYTKRQELLFLFPKPRPGSVHRSSNWIPVLYCFQHLQTARKRSL